MDPFEKLNQETKNWNLNNHNKIKDFLTVIRNATEPELENKDFKCPGCEAIFKDNRLWS